MASPTIAVNPAPTANPSTNRPTGPRTPEGKARSAQNARKHGFSAQLLAVLPSEQADFDIYQNELLDKIKPEPGVQADLFRQLVHAGWSLIRLERFELEILAEGNPFKSADSQTRLDRLERYRASHRRAYARILNEIRKLQTSAMLWATTHEVLREKLQNEMPLANPAVHDVSKNIRDMSNELHYGDAARLLDSTPSAAANYFDKTNSTGRVSCANKPATGAPRQASA